MLSPAFTTRSAAWSKQHLEVMFTVLPAFKLQMGPAEKGQANQPSFSELHWPVFVRSGPALRLNKHPTSHNCYPAGSGGSTQPSLQRRLPKGSNKQLKDSRGRVLRGGHAETGSSRYKTWRQREWLAYSTKGSAQ